MKEIEIVESARKELLNLPDQIQRQIIGKIQSLKSVPFPPNCKKLHGAAGYRIRSGDYRVVYVVGPAMVTILAIGHRGWIYRM